MVDGPCILGLQNTSAVADPGFPVGGANSRGGYVSKNLYVKTKESGPLGGGALATPPGSTNALCDLVCELKVVVFGDIFTRQRMQN